MPPRSLATLPRAVLSPRCCFCSAPRRRCARWLFAPPPGSAPMRLDPSPAADLLLLLSASACICICICICTCCCCCCCCPISLLRAAAPMLLLRVLQGDGSPRECGPIVGCCPLNHSVCVRACVRACLLACLLAAAAAAAAVFSPPWLKCSRGCASPCCVLRPPVCVPVSVMGSARLWPRCCCRRPPDPSATRMWRTPFPSRRCVTGGALVPALPWPETRL